MSGLTELLIGAPGRIGYVSLQAGLMAVVIGVLLAAMGKRVPPRWRCALWTLVVVRLLLPWAPSSPVSLYNLLPVARPSSLGAEMQRATEAGEGEGVNGVNGENGAESAVERVVALVERDTASTPALVSGETAGPIASAVPSETLGSPSVGSEPGLIPYSEYAKTSNAFADISLVAAFGGLWLLGVLMVAGIAIGQGARPYLLIGRQRFCTDQKTLELLEACKGEMGIHPWLAVVETPLVGSPALFGFVRPRLLLPPGAIEALGPERLRHVFLHELAHLRRRDIAWNWLATAALAIHWFNPLAWIAVGRLRAEREMACDELVLSCAHEADPADYGRTLIALTESFSRARRMPGLAGIFENHPQIRRRIAMITGWTRTSGRATVLAALLTGLVAVVTLTEAQSPASTSAGKTGGVADIVAKDFKLVPYPEGGLFRAVVEIRNDGDAGTPKFVVLFTREKSGKAEPLFPRSQNGAGPIGAGEQWNEGSSPFALKEGVNVIGVVLDADDEVAESDEENNIAVLTAVVMSGRIVEQTRSVGNKDIYEVPVSSGDVLAGVQHEETTVRQGESLPDVTITDIRLAPYPEGGLHSIVTRVRNQGDAPVGKYKVHFLQTEENGKETLLGGRVSGSGPFAAGGGQSETCLPFALRDGTTRFRVVLDPDNAVAEEDETNNSASLSIVVRDGRIVEENRSVEEDKPETSVSPEKVSGPGRLSSSSGGKEEILGESGALPDVRVEDFSIQPYSEGGLYTVTARIRNAGDAAASEFGVKIIREDEEENGGAAGSGMASAGPLAPGAEWNERSLPFALHEGTNRISVTLDPKFRLDESEKANNRAELTVVVEGSQIVRQSVDFPRKLTFEAGRDSMEVTVPENGSLRWENGNMRVDGNRAVVSIHSSASKGQDTLCAVVDGTIVETYPVVKDCMVLNYLPQWRYGNVDNIGVANNDGGVRTLIKWQDVPAELAQRDDLRFLLALYSRQTDVSPPTGAVEVHAVLTDWPERTAWVDQPEAAGEPASSTPVVEGRGWKLFDVTSAVRAADANPDASHGVELRFDREDLSGAKRDWSGYQFVSREGENEWAEYHPLLLAVRANQ